MASDREPLGLGPPDLLLSLDREAPAPLHEQLGQTLRTFVRSGRLPPGSRLPSSRFLAGSLGVSRGVVLEAYTQLVAEGYLVASQGAPTRVAPMAATERPPLPAVSLAPGYEIEFDPGLPDLLAFPREQWSRSLRAALRQVPFASLGHADPRGAPELRNELMRYLGRARAAAPEPEHTLVCAGAAAGLASLFRTLAGRGIERVALEDPGWARHRQTAQLAGLEPVPVPVDGHGIDVDALGASGCEVVVVTPAHQFPTGAVLSAERRAALLEWAEEEDALIVEDDYDSELRYDRVPVGSLQGVAPERVAHVGSLSKRLAPGLRLGWILSPSWLSGALTYEQGLAGAVPPALEQIALADFLARGELDRHLRRMRRRYRERRTALLAALTRRQPRLALEGSAGGLFVLALLPANEDEESFIAAAGALGVGLEGLAGHRLQPGPPGIVFGFANLSEAVIERGIARLAM